MRRLRVLIPAAVGLLALLILYTLYRTPGPLSWSLVRAAALFGYCTLFLVIVSTEYLREMRKLFGRPFLTVHHILAVTALALIIIHPITDALASRDMTVFVPQFTSVRTFFALGGRVAWYLIFIAVFAALLRARIKSFWRFIHWLNYVAFALAFVHSWLLGTDISTSALRFIWPVMAGIVLLIWVHKRLTPSLARRA
jgi:DMSO/TMAO reductase YedYZ heme-binding membrane subunit